MRPTEKSRYRNAKALESLEPKQAPGAVRFHAHGFAIGAYRDNKGLRNECVIRFLVHAGQAVEIALSPDIAGQLGADLIAKGGAQ